MAKMILPMVQPDDTPQPCYRCPTTEKTDFAKPVEEVGLTIDG